MEALSEIMKACSNSIHLFTIQSHGDSLVFWKPPQYGRTGADDNDYDDDNNSNNNNDNDKDVVYWSRREYNDATGGGDGDDDDNDDDNEDKWQQQQQQQQQKRRRVTPVSLCENCVQSSSKRPLTGCRLINQVMTEYKFINFILDRKLVCDICTRPLIKISKANDSINKYNLY
jgi:hypothetical protein